MAKYQENNRENREEVSNSQNESLEEEETAPMGLNEAELGPNTPIFSEDEGDYGYMLPEESPEEDEVNDLAALFRAGEEWSEETKKRPS